MIARCLLLAACLLVAMLQLEARAAAGDVIVPAHRSSNGTMIPANVPPSSGGTYMPRVGHKLRAKVPRPVSRHRAGAAPVPMFVQARSINR
ncbi:MAG: hypothetical protein ABI699_06275 [Caldimonas sp.]